MSRLIFYVMVGVLVQVQFSLASDFDEKILRLNAINLAKESLMAEVLTTAEIKVLREHRGATSFAKIDQLLAPKALIQLSINPETRLYAKRTRARLPDVVCGEPSPWLIRIVNQGYITSAINLTLNGIPVQSEKDIYAEVIGERLEGAKIEYRVMTLVTQRRRLTDVTLMFDVGSGTEDLGARSELSVLIGCKNM